MDVHPAITGFLNFLASSFAPRHMSTQQRIRVEFGQDLSDELVQTIHFDALMLCTERCQANRNNPHAPFRRHEPGCYVNDILCDPDFRQYVFVKYLYLDPASELLTH